MTSPNSILRSPSLRSGPGGLKKKCEQVGGGVGLGIVAALEKSSRSGQGEIVPKFLVGSLNLNHNRSVPIPILVRVGGGGGGGGGRGGCSKQTATSQVQPGARADDVANAYRRRRTSSVFCESSPPAIRVGGGSAILQIPAFPTPDFLSSCHLCHKKLQDRDIYMYRGEKAFCSTECRYQQIVTDERTEKCRVEGSRPHQHLSASPYTNSPLFSPGIIAT